MSRVTTGLSPAAPARILVVDDQEAVRDVTRAVLMKAGYEVAVASDGAEAVAAVRDLPFDLVLMDIHMAVMDGLAATRQIRLLSGARSRVPIIALCNDGPGLADAGVDDHLGKPFRKVDLFRKIDQWLGRPSGSVWRQPAVQPPSVGGILDEACELMGRPWTLRALHRLVTEIDEVFAAGSGVRLDETGLARHVHGMVSLAALLGFASLSMPCSNLEDACRNRRDAARAFEQARASALSARAIALRFIA